MQTSQKSIFDIIEETSTSSAGDSPVNPTQAQGNDLEKKMTDTSGQKCLDAFGRFPRVGSWARMFSALLIGQEGWSSTRCRLTWKLKGTKYNRLYFQLVPSKPLISDKGSGLLLTPTSVMTDEPPEKMRERAERNGYKNGTQYGSLLSQVKYSEMLPTPTTDSATNRKDKYKQGGTPLSVAVNKMLPTPNATDYRDKPTSKSWKEQGAVNYTLGNPEIRGLLPTQSGQQDGKTSQLNPQFVEEMMGFPENWTASPFQSGETNPSKPTGTP
jgi:hypothetical protein